MKRAIKTNIKNLWDKDKGREGLVRGRGEGWLGWLGLYGRKTNKSSEYARVPNAPEATVFKSKTSATPGHGTRAAIAADTK
jgi:hypothetical protein